MKNVFFLLLIFMALAMIDLCNADTPKSACKFRAYVTDNDPHGLNVRSGPRRNAKIIGVIPTQKVDVILNIDDSKNGWFHFNDIDIVSPDDSVNATVKEGWVSGTLIGVTLQANAYGKRGGDFYLYEQPDLSSRKIVRIVDDVQAISQIVLKGCKDAWLYIDVIIEPKTKKKLTGWLYESDYCGNPLTTCP